MKLLCWNINSLAPTVRNAVLKHGSWLGFFQEHGLDIACLQESKVPEDKLTKELCCVDGYQSFWAHSRQGRGHAPDIPPGPAAAQRCREKKGYSGVTTYASDAYAPLVLITDHGAFVLVNVYVPNAGDRPDRPRLHYKLRFLAALRRKCEELAVAGRELLLVGDFNVPAEARDVHPDLLPGGSLDELYGQEERAALHALTAAYPDVWRRLHPQEAATYSVWNEKTSARAFNRGLRIDYVLCTPGLLGRVVSCEILGPEVLPPNRPCAPCHSGRYCPPPAPGMLLKLRDVPPLPPHPPCQEWQRLHRRFVDTSQRSILGMFGAAGKKRAAAAPAAPAVPGSAAAAAPAPESAAAGPGAGSKGAEAGGDGADQDAGHRKKQRHDGSEAPAPAAEGDAAPPGPAGEDGSGQDAGEQGGGAASAGEAKPGSRSGEAAGKQQSGKPAAGRGKARGKQQQKQQQQKGVKEASEGGGQRTIGSFFAAAGGG
ncbi:hypothetical protein CHLNCDRAFT_142087 [Chlorella variabilis]|uniref:DNA-(apurinic or apyrimidinic site) endonuclease n=1 Tax=Chlorella variabilis TaxID=554065 RepID=E1Z7Q9_CHLVA|nr:hypothetical protein CHLNCDRAFT_142087 [Chlorella variabilis]EFN58215.1 hypothetical protein CHLNCDRAFT_142087 [Chlorella variabilis]|eukprot:XP_005850317.1 hypothetical protein CHLNCDRAFT_142087 [Chlorella variabilis]